MSLSSILTQVFRLETSMQNLWKNKKWEAQCTNTKFKKKFKNVKSKPVRFYWYMYQQKNTLLFLPSLSFVCKDIPLNDRYVSWLTFVYVTLSWSSSPWTGCRSVWGRVGAALSSGFVGDEWISPSVSHCSSWRLSLLSTATCTISRINHIGIRN